jgi:hypothetical protein
MTLSFESLLSTELKATADGVKSKRGFQPRARILRRIFPESFHWRKKRYEIKYWLLNVKTSFR